MKFARSSGVLLHPTSLPSAFGIGDLGKEARKFIDFLAASKVHLWQLLPLAPTGYGDSPYQCFSAFAGNTLMISPEKLVEDEFLTEQDLLPVPKFNKDKVDFAAVIDYKKNILTKAFQRFQSTTSTMLRTEFLGFCNRTSKWLDDYALFRVLKDEHGGSAWNKWATSLKMRDPDALEAARDRLQQEIEAEKFYQFLFFRQWDELREYCHQKDVHVIGDLPIFVAYDSADVWTSPHYFKLDEKLAPLTVAGVPPDYFSATGQLWGNPIYDWERMKSDNFAWWVERIGAMLTTVDILRIDHFRGFAACWEIPGGDKTAERGRWVNVPGHDLFARLNDVYGDLPIIVEDLGLITPDVEALRDEFNFPGMRVLQMAFSGGPTNCDLLHNHVPNCIVYTGTHDNDTAVGWFNSKAGASSTRTAAQIKQERAACMRYLRGDEEEIHWSFIEAVYGSVGHTAIVPLQDILGLGSESRMNLPASQQGNWSWRYRDNALTTKAAKRLRELVEVYDRDHAFAPMRTLATAAV